MFAKDGMEWQGEELLYAVQFVIMIGPSRMDTQIWRYFLFWKEELWNEGDVVSQGKLEVRNQREVGARLQMIGHVGIIC